MNQPHDPGNPPGPWPQQASQPWPQQGGQPWPQQANQPWPPHVDPGGGQPWPHHGGHPFPQQGNQPWPQQAGGGQPWPPQANHPGGAGQPWPQQPGHAGPHPHPGYPPGGPWPPGPGMHPGPWAHAPGQPHAWPGMLPLRPQYEFTPEENETLAELAQWSGALGGLKLLQALMGFVGRNVIGGFIELWVGLSLLGARKSLRAAVETEGNDVDHLMIAVDKLATVFKIRLILFTIGAGLVAVVAAFVLVMVLTGHGLDLEELL